MGYIEDIKAAAAVDLPWNQLTGKNILVTGATGLIGACVVEILMSHIGIDYHVYASGRNEKRVYDLFSDYNSSPYFHFFKYDVTEVLQSDIDFHFIIAAASGANPVLYNTDPVGVMKANFCGVDNLLSYGKNHGLEKFLYISSGEVYGEGDGREFSEEYSGYVNCATVRACYPSSKRASETLCEAYAHQFNINVCIARPCHIYGPHFSDSDTRVYAQFIRNVINGEDIVMKSTGAQYRSWCYVVDCASALLYILLLGEKGQAYNVADSSSNITIKELAEIIAGIAHRNVIVDVPSDLEEQGFNIVSKSIFLTNKLEALGWSVSLGNMRDKMNKTISELL